MGVKTKPLLLQPKILAPSTLVKCKDFRQVCWSRRLFLFSGLFPDQRNLAPATLNLFILHNYSLLTTDCKVAYRGKCTNYDLNVMKILVFIYFFTYIYSTNLKVIRVCGPNAHGGYFENLVNDQFVCLKKFKMRNCYELT